MRSSDWSADVCSSDLKRSGQVRYAVLSFGGFLGMGSDHYPLPWSMLNYDTEKGGYVVDLAKDILDQAPRHLPDERPDYDDAYGRSLDRKSTRLNSSH